MKKRCILIGAVYGLVLLGWGITGTFSPAAPTRSEQSDNAVPVETIQLEQLCRPSVVIDDAPCRVCSKDG